jgi:hypothetical protein
MGNNIKMYFRETGSQDKRCTNWGKGHAQKPALVLVQLKSEAEEKTQTARKEI